MKVLHLLILITSIVSCQENQLDIENTADQINQIGGDQNSNESEGNIDTITDENENFNEIEVIVECPRPMVTEFSFKLFDSNGVDLLSTPKYNYNDIMLYVENQKNYPIALEPSINNQSLLGAFYFEKHRFYTLSINGEEYIIELDLMLEEGSSYKDCQNFVIKEVILNEQIQCVDCNLKEYITLTLN